ncbi:lysine transporter LysE [Actinoplanes ianthinogenes]|uniref:Lysine transporter LysE n=1 Tax=Actinoplanes ianthinogenes TaxID=122358 RepID=A0ABN6CSB7_9ACTN|nr:LysE family translocator [Actinoplanes ianthinogenes]BCJ48146.1 lysine transporter LysE [Actinoplanes ianthinogenes]GGR06755.1 lysine transporter LysE [Actinoplanes ianthinogenes]
MSATLVVAFLVTAFLLSIVPGPDMLFIVANATVGGRRAGVVAAAGMSTGLAGHSMAAAFGLSALVRAAPEALTIVRIVGAVFLVYLAVGSWRASRDSSLTAPQVPRRSLSRIYAMATLTNLANPKILLFYLTFLPQFLTLGDGAWPVWEQLLILGALFIVVGFPVDAVVGLTVGSVADRLIRRPAVRRRLDRLSALVFGALAVRLVTDTR